MRATDGVVTTGNAGRELDRAAAVWVPAATDPAIRLAPDDERAYLTGDQRLCVVNRPSEGSPDALISSFWSLWL